MVFINGDLCEYYAWFIKKRFNLDLVKPLRGAHISFINDSIRDMQGNSEVEKRALWEAIKNKYNGKYVDINLNISNLKTMGNGEHWWFIVDHDHRDELHDIRKELGLDRPYFGLHMTIGLAINSKENEDDMPSLQIFGKKANKMNVEYSEYIHGLIEKNFIKK